MNTCISIVSVNEWEHMEIYYFHFWKQPRLNTWCDPPPSLVLMDGWQILSPPKQKVVEVECIVWVRSERQPMMQIWWMLFCKSSTWNWVSAYIEICQNFTRPLVDRRCLMRPNSQCICAVLTSAWPAILLVRHFANILKNRAAINECSSEQKFESLIQCCWSCRCLHVFYCPSTWDIDVPMSN